MFLREMKGLVVKVNKIFVTHYECSEEATVNERLAVEEGKWKAMIRN